MGGGGQGSYYERRCETNGNYSQARSHRKFDGAEGARARGERQRQAQRKRERGKREDGTEFSGGCPLFSPIISSTFAASFLFLPLRVSPAGRKLYRGPMMHRPEMARVVPGRKCGTYVPTRADTHTHPHPHPRYINTYTSAHACISGVPMDVAGTALGYRARAPSPVAHKYSPDRDISEISPVTTLYRRVICAYTPALLFRISAG